MSRHELEPALSALAWALDTRAFGPLPDRVLFLGARLGQGLPHPEWDCVQPLRPLFERLQARHPRTSGALEGDGYTAVLVLAPRSREATRARLAQALDALLPGGLLVAVAGNAAGGRTLLPDLQALLGQANGTSKKRCRIAWAHRQDALIDSRHLQAWRALGEVRRVQDGDVAFWTRPGLFAWDRVDAASVLLAEHLPASLSGRVADAGAGWGYLSMQLLRRCPGITALELFEADAAALEPAQRNLNEALGPGPGPAVQVHWHDVAGGLPGRFDAVVMNPPFHAGRAAEPGLGQAFIASAARALTPHGSLWLVANRHLPYEAGLKQGFRVVEQVVEQDGFKVLHARGPHQ